MSQQPILLHMVRSAKPSPTLHPSSHSSSEKVTYPYTHSGPFTPTVKTSTYCKPLFMLNCCAGIHTNLLDYSSRSSHYFTVQKENILHTTTNTERSCYSVSVWINWWDGISCNSIFILWKASKLGTSLGINNKAQIQKHMKSVRLWLVGCRATNLTTHIPLWHELNDLQAWDTHVWDLTALLWK